MKLQTLVPTMTDQPEKKAIANGITYWIAAFLALPFVMILFTADIYNRHDWVIWFEIGYHALNFVATLVFFCGYLKESFFNVQLCFKSFISTVLICLVLVVFLKIAVFIAAAVTGMEFWASAALGSLLTSEMDLLYFSCDLPHFSPVYGTICLVFLAPVTTSCLYYACCFAPVCSTRRWGAYPVVALALLIPRLALALSVWTLSEELIIYALQLPVHLLLCWAYQKTDTIWAPITVIALSNLLIGLLFLFI